MQTNALNLKPMTREDVVAMVAAMSRDERAQLSADWLARIDASTTADPWTHGFALVERQTSTSVGKCVFKGPPGVDGAVEIAYAIEPEHQGKGYATEAAAALVGFAFDSGLVQVVVAHTIPEPNASTRVLTKCGFSFAGDVVDPEDGRVWRWEKRREPVK